MLIHLQLYKLALNATGQAQVSEANFRGFIDEIKSKLKEIFFDLKKVRREDTGTDIYGTESFNSISLPM